ncbi:MAG: histidine--tRNA ligase [Solirubrobacterales bacterium]|nr:histidine--tRNA ligase [Solirubrobacterales bacterium]
MSGARIKAPRGTFDVWGEEAGRRARLEAAARAILEGAGYERIETPAFEATELFARGVGESTDIVQKEMYTFEDGSGRSLTLRPEGTAPVCRAYVEHGMHKRAAPVKLWYLGSFFRYERAQAGRYRQFWQVGVEALGSEDPAVDAESITLMCALLEEMGVREGRLRVGSLGSGESRAEYRERLRAHLRAHEYELSAEVRGRIDSNPLRAFDSDHPGTRAVMESAPRLMHHLEREDREHFEAVCALLERAGVAHEVDDTLVRGLDYYTRTVFEYSSEALGAQSGVGGGGRYDGLVQELGGPRTPGIGWAAGVERMLLAGREPPARTGSLELYVGTSTGAPDAGAGRGAHAEARGAAFELLRDARSAGLSAQMEMAGRSPKGQRNHAHRVGARYLALVGADDRASLRDMEDGGERELAAAEVVHAVLQGLRRLS